MFIQEVQFHYEHKSYSNRCMEKIDRIIGKKLQAIREKTKLSRDKFADEIDTTGTTLYRLEKGLVKVTEEWIDVYSKRFGFDPETLFRDEEMGIPIMGEVGAGGAIYSTQSDGDDENLERVDAPPGMDVHGYVGVRVKGDSMYPRYLDGEILLYKRDCDWSPDYINHECIIELMDGMRCVKIIRKGS